MTPEQRRGQIGRIHAAAASLDLRGMDYRDLLLTLTGGPTSPVAKASCRSMSDRQINHVLDWLNYLAGRRARQPLSFPPGTGNAQVNLARLCHAIADIVPPGFERPPLRSASWQHRTAGRAAESFDDFEQDELRKLVEGLKAIFRRAGDRGTATLDSAPLDSPKPAARRAV
jgi:hypothetical protein